MRSRSQERHPRAAQAHTDHHHHTSSKSHSQTHKDHHSRGKSSSSSNTNNNSNDKHHHRSGLRIFIGTANLANSVPDPSSLAAFLPHHGKVHHVLRSDSLKSSSVVDGVKDNFNHVDTHGKFEIIAVGFQEATSGTNIVTTAGITAAFTGSGSGERSGFSRAMGAIGKPFDAVNNFVGDAVGGAAKAADVGGIKKLRDAVVRHIGEEDYTVLTEYQRGEVVLFVFVRNDMADLAKVCDVKGENVGFGSVMANKCGIAAVISMGTTRIAFLSAHLAAHEGQYKLRNDNMAEILAGTEDPTLTSHHAFVFGDLNYRCELPKQGNGQELPKEEAKFVAQKIVHSKAWGQLYKLDGLNKALENKDALVGFRTPECKFPPTFKVEKKEGFHYQFQRTPSYTDRILYKSNENTRSVEPIIYEACGKCTSSDHKPVRGVFFLPNRSPLSLDNMKCSVLNVEISGIICKGLKPSEGLLDNDIDSFVRVRCEPEEMLKSSVRNKFKTSTIKTSDRPMWRKETLKFSINVTSKEQVAGSSIYFESVQENMIAGNSVIGTCVFDLEECLRNNMGKKDDGGDQALSFELLRFGKCVGKLTCDLSVSWGKEQTKTSTQETHNKTTTHRSNSNASSDKEKKSSTHRSNSTSSGEGNKSHKKESFGSSDHGHRSKSKSSH